MLAEVHASGRISLMHRSKSGSETKGITLSSRLGVGHEAKVLLSESDIRRGSSLEIRIKTRKDYVLKRRLKFFREA
jgi:hypothetical protein